MKRITGLILCGVLIPGLAYGAPSLVRHTVDGGGGSAGNSSFRLVGTTGQPEPNGKNADNSNWSLRGGFWAVGSHAVTAVELPSALPARFQLHPNVPNPFNPSTSIRFDVPVSSRVRVEVYNLRGERIRVLRDERLVAGRHQTTWDGRDARGAGIASGVYVVRVVAEGFEDRQKVTLVK